MEDDPHKEKVIISIPNWAPAQALAYIKAFEWAHSHRRDPSPIKLEAPSGVVKMTEIENPHVADLAKSGFSTKDIEWITSGFDVDNLLRLASVADHLHAPDLGNLANAYIASLIKGMSTEEMAITLNEEMDFTPAERAILQQEQAFGKFWERFNWQQQ